MPIFHRNPLTIEPCDSWFYGGLIQISLGYTPVEGRLHTCYAPVRRSSAESKLSLLPLDLHVLGLPLAFILSQDQTLHCKSLKIDSQSRLTLVGLSHHFKELLSEPVPLDLNITPKRGDKDTSLSNPHKLQPLLFSLSSVLAAAPCVQSGGKCRADSYTGKPLPIFFSIPRNEPVIREQQAPDFTGGPARIARRGPTG